MRSDLIPYYVGSVNMPCQHMILLPSPALTGRILFAPLSLPAQTGRTYPFLRSPKEVAGWTRRLVIRAARYFIEEVLGVCGVRMPLFTPGHGLDLGSPAFNAVNGKLFTVDKTKVSF
ncbi:hypothetical protein AVEN_167359-1 [Araneus ventricosus]|uniref:Uncharacterized protein n=1 Tax=Araneus ventricosus TaxID=182803 RepID=A0A4Y2QIF4_ARAVE|nr:hypothetical protein AVEN_167359-1 [Araneus ventricosus]